MSDFDFSTEFDDASGFGVPIFGSGFADILAVVLNSPRETSPLATASLIGQNDILSAQSFRLDLKQQSTAPGRFAGEGADANMLAVGLISIKGSIKMPLAEPAIGWVEPVLATLWDRAGLAWWGTSTASLANVTAPLAISDTIIYVDNIVDFVSLEMPFNLRLFGTGETEENLVVSSVDKNNRALTVSTPIAYTHTTNAIVAAEPYNVAQGPAREPAFTLMSLREGILAPCLVNKITIEADAGKPVGITIDINSTRIYREGQIDMRANRQNILDMMSSMSAPIRLVNGTTVKISPSSANSGAFGLSTALGDPLFSGYQGLDFPDFTITGISVSVDNKLAEVYSTHSIEKTYEARRLSNSYPYALVSEGRVISGKIRYKSPLEAWQVVERLAGPSFLAGGGLVIDFSNFSITLTEIAWSPSSGSGDVSETETRELEWTMVSENRNSMPVLEFSSQV